MSAAAEIGPGRRFDKLGAPIKSELRLDHWFGGMAGRLTLWRAAGSEWAEVATSTSTRVLAQRFGIGSTYCVTRAGARPADAPPLEVAPVGGAMFTW